VTAGRGFCGARIVLTLAGPMARATEAQALAWFKIGALTESWGPTPTSSPPRRLQELGYRGNQDFVIGVRFAQGNVAELPQRPRSGPPWWWISL